MQSINQYNLNVSNKLHSQWTVTGRHGVLGVPVINYARQRKRGESDSALIPSLAVEERRAVQAKRLCNQRIATIAPVSSITSTFYKEIESFYNLRS